ncbi:MAG: carboxypeptidase-like regulatory domain-containing protein [Terracidiphilus sp.]
MNLKKLMYLSLLLSLLSITTPIANAQTQNEPPSLSGTVLDALDGKPFKNVRIWIMDEFSDRSQEIHADKTGHYSIQLPEGYYFVLIGAGGYIAKCKNIWVLPGKTIDFSVRLSPDHENMIMD